MVKELSVNEVHTSLMNTLSRYNTPCGVACGLDVSEYNHKVCKFCHIMVSQYNQKYPLHVYTYKEASFGRLQEVLDTRLCIWYR